MQARDNLLDVRIRCCHQVEPANHHMDMPVDNGRLGNDFFDSRMGTANYQHHSLRRLED